MKTNNSHYGKNGLKKRILQGVISMLLVCILSLQGMFVAQAADIMFPEDLFACEEFMQDLREQTIAEFGQDFVINHDRSAEIANMLVDSFPQSRIDGTRIYPDYYGGLYIDADGNLVVLLVSQGNHADFSAHSTFQAIRGTGITIVRSGTVRSNVHSVRMRTQDGIYFTVTNTIKSTMLSQPGDSGGIVFAGSGGVAGITVGRTTDGSLSFASRADRIIQALVLELR